MAIPWRIMRLDPHDLHDPIAALFGPSCCDALYDLDGAGRPYPALAASLPEAGARAALVRLRAGLRSARGRTITAADVVSSLERARRVGGAVWIAAQAPHADDKDPLLVHFPGATSTSLAASLASPLLAIVPRAFSPSEPDGTGSFAAELAGGALLLSRNPSAARGASFLERVEVRTARDLAEGLRAFESAAVDVGWLGSGLHRARPGARAFRGGEYGWVVLRSGKHARRWSAPGVMQQLLDGLEPQLLGHLGLEGLSAQRSFQGTWAGGPAELCVSADSPQLVAIARTLAASLERPGQPMTVTELARGELEQRRSQRDFTLMLDFVRRLGPSGPWTQLALLSAQDPELAKKPPRVSNYDAREICRSLTLGVVGELWIGGAHAPEFDGLAGWQLGGVWRNPSSTPAANAQP